MRGDKYQLYLIALGVVTTFLLGVFFYRELFPEYKIYQNDYIELEKFRSSYTGEPPPVFTSGVKQIVIERADKGPALVDRCISCHVALQFSHFSPTKIATDVNGNVVLDEQGLPVQVPNDEYIWAKLDEKIASLTDEKEKHRLESLKTAHVGDHVYDVRKVLTMHPLIGRETRPFEFHPIDDYGCVSCHNGNERGLTTEKAHGPVFDGEYEIEFMGHSPNFTELDSINDPQFSKQFNHKPGHELLFQTTPIFVGALIEAKCVQCHQSSQNILRNAVDHTSNILDQQENKRQTLQNALNQEQQALFTYLMMKKEVLAEGVSSTVQSLKKKNQNYTFSDKERKQMQSQIRYLTRLVGGEDGLRIQNAQPAKDVVLQDINEQLFRLLGSKELVDQISQLLDHSENFSTQLDQFLLDHQKDVKAKGPIFDKLHALENETFISQRLLDAKSGFENIVGLEKDKKDVRSDIDLLTQHYHQGENLYISQACYACHRISGFSRGGVGPELTEIGKYYPWYIKGKLVWPQGDLPTSTMPNYRLDHEELEDLMTYLLGQQGAKQAVSPVDYKIDVQNWEAGKKRAWEKPTTPAQIQDLDYSRTVFATQGCAACHRLRGFESNVGFKTELESKDDLVQRLKEVDWFKQLIPETIMGSELVNVLDQHSKEIDQRIVEGIRENSILESIEKNYPGIIESFYTPFKYAARAKNYDYQQRADLEKDPVKKQKILNERQEWKKRVHRVLMVFVQEYGLGRLVGPRPNWSGVYRTDEWLMEHFRNPSSKIPRSIMPVFPFDETKFYALTHMLDVLGKKNRNEQQQVWDLKGFSPELAFKTYCAQCHGEYLAGNGPVSEWIYPIPKNLRSQDFLRNLTRERVVQSLTHGIHGTPMPPWGEVAVGKTLTDLKPILNQSQIEKLVDWLFFNLPGANTIQGPQDVPKWEYNPQDVLKELKDEGGQLRSFPTSQEPSLNKELSTLSAELLKAAGYYADLNPKVIKHPVKSLEVDDLFDKEKNPIQSPDEELYYIKKRYYTPENLQQGQEFFEMNCAICHGREGAGSGARAGFMQDAKPRMLTNLAWLESHDDLRLLRSIKYGVAGTAMTPWGDVTTSLQRLQLVMFIRTLSQESKKRNDLNAALYQAFEQNRLMIENMRVLEAPTLSGIEVELQKIKLKREDISRQLKNNELSYDQAAQAYEAQLSLEKKYHDQNEVDLILQNLILLEKKQSELYQNFGITLITKGFGEEDLQLLLNMIKANEDHFSIKDDILVFNESSIKNEEIDKNGTALIQIIKEKMTHLEEELEVEEGKFPSIDQRKKINDLKAEILGLKQLYIKGISEFEELKQLQTKEKNIYEKFKHNNKPLASLLALQDV